MEFLKKAVANREIHIVCFIDGPKDSQSDLKQVADVEIVAQKFKEFHKNFEIVKSDVNLGLARSILSGTQNLFANYDSVVVIEDDILINESCLDYFQFFLTRYKNYKEIFSISSFNPANPRKLISYKYDIFATFRMQCWGWATWKDRWDKVDWQVSDYEYLIENRKVLEKYKNEVGIDSLERLRHWKTKGLDVWASRFVLAHVLNDAKCICPVLSHSANIGLDGSGTHCGLNQNYPTFISSQSLFDEVTDEYNYFSESYFRFPDSPHSLPSVNSWFFDKEHKN